MLGNLGRGAQPVSGHLSYWYWGHPHGFSDETIAVGYDREQLERFFGDVQPVATIRTPHGVHNMEDGAVVWICRRQRADWDTLWPQMRTY